MKANFNEKQVENLSKYFTDLSKILLASSVIGFFIPANPIKVSLPAFIGGLVWTIWFLWASLKLIQEKQC